MGYYMNYKNYLRLNSNEICSILFRRLNQPIDCDYVEVYSQPYIKIIISFKYTIIRGTKYHQYDKLIVLFNDNVEYAVSFIRTMVSAEVINLLREWINNDSST